MSTYTKYKENIKQTNEARRAAVRRLINAHRDEFDELYLDEAIARGLNPTKIRSKMKKAEDASRTEEEFRTAVAAEVEKILSAAQTNTEIKMESESASVDA